jgi:hypothetical protein
MATSRIKQGSYSQPTEITLTLSRADLKGLAEGLANFYKGFRMPGGFRLNITVKAEPPSN